MEEKTIVFTISPFGKGYKVTTKDTRGIEYNRMRVTCKLYDWMSVVTEELNSKGYSVLFEIE